jgi:hypothetical protein
MNRDFKGIWIPREIWLAKDLSCQEKCLWAEIHSLFDRERGGCYASNEYLMEFFGIKERRLQEMMANLKHKGWVVQVSFDGRTRIIKAVVPPEDFKPEVKLEVGAGQGCGKVHLSDAESCGSEMQDPAPLPIYREKSLVTTIDTPPIPPPKEPAKAESAKASEMEDLNSKSKRKRTPSDFSPKIREVGEKLIQSLIRAKPDYVPPKNLSAFLTEVDFLLRLDKRDPQKIYDVFNWALADSFWADKMFKPNPAKYLREKFDQLEMKMNAKPEKKDRKFAPSSNDERSLKKMEEWAKGAL